MFSNGSAAEYGLTAYPLFGLGQTVLTWYTFAENMGNIAIGNVATWCQACGNTTGTCANLRALFRPLTRTRTLLLPRQAQVSQQLSAA